MMDDDFARAWMHHRARLGIPEPKPKILVLLVPLIVMLAIVAFCCLMSSY